MRYINDNENFKITLYPHGVLKEAGDETPVQVNGSNDFSVTVTDRVNKILPRNISDIHQTEYLTFDRSNEATSEGYSPLELVEYCTSLSFSSSITGDFGSANLTLELPYYEASQLLGGVIAHSLTNSNIKMRNLCTGAWVVIKEKSGRDYVGRFFGQVTAVQTSLGYVANGVPLTQVTMKIDSFYAGYMRNQLKQTMSRDDSIKELEPSAVFQAGDYSQGFLSTIKESFKGQNPATILADVINALGGHKLPASLARFNDYPVGLALRVCDGSYDSMNKFGLKGSDIDVIKGKIMTLYQGASSNNITHHETIMQMFNSAPQLFEYFAILVPMTKRELSNVSKSKLFSRLGGIPVIIYRYKPVYPYAPPTSAGFDSMYRLKYNRVNEVKNKTDFEKFFGSPQPANYYSQTGQVYRIEERYVTSLDLSIVEDERINFVFVEGGFSNAQGHALNYFRNNASPTLNKSDINRHGLRAQAMHTPFVSLDTDPETIKNFNMQAPNALAERLFHNIGMGHTFSRGSFTVEAPESIEPVPVGNWVSIGLTDTDLSFTCYIEAINTTVSADLNGIIRHVSVYSFSRGHHGIHAPQFDLDKYESEELTLLITNEDKQA